MSDKFVRIAEVDRQGAFFSERQLAG